eukprot:Skav221037  [mRNA]  locus=scaffold1448:152264:156129:+ [translate_table: standard]
MTSTSSKRPKVGSGTREFTTLRLGDASLSIDAAGGSIAAFQLASFTNPLSWDSAVHDGLDPAAKEPRPLGHFLCLDRWGPPSEEEERQGMPYHGEASTRSWHVSSASHSAVLTSQLPMAGLKVERCIELLKCSVQSSRHEADHPSEAFQDAMETSKKSFCCFLLEIPSDFAGVQSVTLAEQGAVATTLRLSEKGSERKFEVQHGVQHGRRGEKMVTITPCHTPPEENLEL